MIKWCTSVEKKLNKRISEIMFILFILQITPTAVRWLQMSTKNRPLSVQTRPWSPWWTVSLTTPTLPSKKRNSVFDSSKSVIQSCMPRTSTECCNDGTQFIGLMVLFLCKQILLICTFSDNAGFIVSSAILYFFNDCIPCDIVHIFV